MGKLEDIDRKFFCVTALDFYKHQVGPLLVQISNERSLDLRFKFAVHLPLTWLIFVFMYRTWMIPRRRLSLLHSRRFQVLSCPTRCCWVCVGQRLGPKALGDRSNQHGRTLTLNPTRKMQGKRGTPWRVPDKSSSHGEQVQMTLKRCGPHPGGMVDAETSTWAARQFCDQSKPRNLSRQMTKVLLELGKIGQGGWSRTHKKKIRKVNNTPSVNYHTLYISPNVEKRNN